MCDDSQPRKLLSTRHTVIISTLWLGYCEENPRVLTPELFIVDRRSWGCGNSALSPSHRSVLHGALKGDWNYIVDSIFCVWFIWLAVELSPRCTDNIADYVCMQPCTWNVPKTWSNGQWRANTSTQICRNQPDLMQPELAYSFGSWCTAIWCVCATVSGTSHRVHNVSLRTHNP